MNDTFGKRFKITLFGASHTPSLGVYIEGVPTGYRVNKDELQAEIDRRKPNNEWTTPRREKDIPKITYSDNIVVIIFENNDIIDKDYSEFQEIPRPSHADFVQLHKYNDPDILGGGIASGRMTLPIVAAGYVAKDILKKMYKDIEFHCDIEAIGGKTDPDAQLTELKHCHRFGDSVGASLKCVVKNPPRFIGEPFFDSVESTISHLMFSIPGIKAIEFGDGVECSLKRASMRNDIFIDEYGHTSSNNEGGINGGITNGNDLVVTVHAKPTPSVGLKQVTFNFKTKQMEPLEIEGRHDICFALRLPVVIEAVVAISLLNLCQPKRKRFGLIGKNISYSKSKELFDKEFKGEYEYEIIDTDNISRELLLKYDGVNVTTPYKLEVIQYLDEEDEIAKRTNSVNCIKNVNGVLIGYNTDYFGFSKSLERYDIKRMLVLGNGGVVNTIREYCRVHDIELTVCGRSGDYDVNYLDLEDYDYGCIVNATTFGFVPPIIYSMIKEDTLVFDLCYGENTAFLNECERYWHQNNISGDKMLETQAKLSYMVWNLK